MNCQSSLYFTLMLKNCAISLISCQSSLPDSLCSNITQLRNNNNITVCFKQIKCYKKVFLLNFVIIYLKYYDSVFCNISNIKIVTCFFRDRGNL
jgi:hypothetical protein